MWQLHAEHRRLHGVEPRAEAERLVMVAIDLPLVPIATEARRQVAVAGDDHAGIAERAQVLRRIEREAAGTTERARRAPTPARADRLRRVLEQPAAVAL